MLSLIVAVCENNVIGNNNSLLWHISDDLKRFKALTLNHKVIMGRKTFDSIPKILPNRTSIVMTKDPNLSINSENVEISYDLDGEIEKYKNCEEEIFIAGGANIYTQSYKFCKNMYITKVYESFCGDSLLEIDYNEFTLTKQSEIFTDEKSGLRYQFLDYTKK